MTIRQTLKQFAIEIGILAFVAMCGVVVPTYLSDAHSQGIAQPPAPVVAPAPQTQPDPANLADRIVFEKLLTR